MNTRLVLIFGALVAVVVAGTIWFLQSTPPAPVVALATPAPAPTPTLALPTPDPASDPMVRAFAPLQPSSPNNLPVQAGYSTTGGTTEWEQSIDRVLQPPNVDPTEKAKRLLNLFPTLPPQGQVFAAMHATNLLQNKDYDLIMPLLKNPALPQQVQDALMMDLMNRDNFVKLPAMLEVAKTPNHPYQQQALLNLQIFLQQDNGTDWARWDAAVRSLLAQQPTIESQPAFPGGFLPVPAPIQVPGQ